jgi:plastocyanin
VGASAAFLIPTASAAGTVTVSTPNTNVANVSIKNFAYNPGNVTVVLGVNNTVVWTNNDSVNHTVISRDNSFSSSLTPGNTFTHTFTAAGVYNYFCMIHNFMKGSVIVLAAPSSSTTSSTGAVPEFPFGAIAIVIVAIIALASFAVLRQTRRS